MFIKPAEGRTVYYERSRIRLPVEGADVPEPLTNHWHRRLNDGDIMVVEAKKLDAERNTFCADAAATADEVTALPPSDIDAKEG